MEPDRSTAKNQTPQYNLPVPQHLRTVFANVGCFAGRIPGAVLRIPHDEHRFDASSVPEASATCADLKDSSDFQVSDFYKKDFSPIGQRLQGSPWARMEHSACITPPGPAQSTGFFRYVRPKGTVSSLVTGLPGRFQSFPAPVLEYHA